MSRRVRLLPVSEYEDDSSSATTAPLLCLGACAHPAFSDTSSHFLAMCFSGHDEKLKRFQEAGDLQLQNMLKSRDYNVVIDFFNLVSDRKFLRNQRKADRVEREQRGEAVSESESSDDESEQSEGERPEDGQEDTSN